MIGNSGMKGFMKMHRRKQEGFTLVELLVAMAISIVVMGSIFYAFKSQQDTYVVQTQVTTMQQSLRGAMYMMVRDVQMAGYYSSFDRDTYLLDSTGLVASGVDDIPPLLYGGAGSGVNGTDVLVIVKCSEDIEELGINDSATASTISLSDVNVGASSAADDGLIDLNAAGKRFGMMILRDLSRAELFEVQSGAGSTLTVTNDTDFEEDYTEGDLICKADVIVYQISNDPDNPCLQRRNLGSDNGFQVVAEDIENLQVRYQLDDGTWVDNPNDATNPPAYTASNVRAVELSLLARTDRPIREWTDRDTYTLAGSAQGPYNDRYRRKVMSTVIETRNIGL